jgi:hypothetical protein
MTEHDKEGLKQLSKDMLNWKFPQPVNTKEAGLILHDVSALLIKISKHITTKLEEYEQSSKG